jgi:hypothetical protein
MIAHALLVVIAADEQGVRLAPAHLIALTRGEIRHLFTVLVVAPLRIPACPHTWSQWRRRHSRLVASFPSGNSPSYPHCPQISTMARPRICPSSSATRASWIWSSGYRFVTILPSGNLSSRIHSKKSGKSVSGSVAPRLPQ